MSVLRQVTEILSSRNLDTFTKINQIPLFDTLLGVKEASEIIKDSILQNKKIALIGDYDVDGIISTFIIKDFFKSLNYDNITFKIPNRFIDGYGINTKIVRELDADVYITADNGITAFEVADLCQNLGKILIISDHHKPLIADGKEILPNAKAVINPHQNACNFIQKDICGAVVAFYLCGGIKNALNANIKLDKYTPFLALAIIADMMPLTSLNRAIYKNGVGNFEKYNIPSLQILKNHCKNNKDENINAQDIGFGIAPMINSSGRMEDAKIALDFFEEMDLNKCQNLLEILKKLNDERKETQEKITKQSKESAIISQNFIFSYGEDFHEGVLGIVASRLADDFDKAAFCLSLKDGILKGSGRSKNGINLIHSVQKCKDLLLGFGGHSGAVGLSLKLENLNSFIKELDKNCIIDSIDESKEVICVKLCEIDEELLKILKSYEPYGVGNEQITFCTKDILVLDSTFIGKDKNHQKLRFSQDGATKDGILFNNKENFANKNVDITFNVARNSYDNEIQLLINDINFRD